MERRLVSRPAGRRIILVRDFGQQDPIDAKNAVDNETRYVNASLGAKEVC